MLMGAFRPQTTTEDMQKHEKIEKVTGSQDDDFVGVLTKNIQNKLALRGLTSWVKPVL
jgi:hypothetical protein